MGLALGTKGMPGSSTELRKALEQSLVAIKTDLKSSQEMESKPVDGMSLSASGQRACQLLK